MVLDIESLRPERGGDPDKVRQNQRDRYCNPGLVDTALDFDDKWKKGLFKFDVSLICRLFTIMYCMILFYKNIIFECYNVKLD